MIKEINILRQKNAEEVLALQTLGYQVEADLIGYANIPPLKDSAETLQQCEETFLGYYINGKLCGAISVKDGNGVLDIHRLFVHPNHFRKGIAQKLLNFIQNRIGLEKMIVTTGSKNFPAVALYEKNGFKKVEEIRVDESLTLTSLEKKF
ncbi:GNAT family N-acetyltransferase [Bacillus sp. J33]|uniref:GNAT family N-acetyltransferase n=1 Tax=Bacillus sp. J33 TaxID=935836 RepID=UPI000478E9B4|nr:GNAT family N-acetyltransferase [Bacillus sp. J33]